jgi:DNA-binding IclR family transcriptional regulator
MSTRQQTRASAQEEGRYRVPALERGLDVLELLAARGLPMTQAEIARALGRGPSELFRTLTALDRRGYLQRDPLSGAYTLTLRLAELGSRHQPHEGLLQAAERPMRALVEATGESCHLSVLHRGNLVVLAQEEGPARVRLSVAVGSAILPRHSASGRLLLAALDPGARAKVLCDDPDWQCLGDGPRMAEQALLAEIAGRGYEAARSETVAGVSDLAVPAGGSAIATRAALAIAALPRDHDAWVAATLPALRRHAAAITDAAGLTNLFDHGDAGGG